MASTKCELCAIYFSDSSGLARHKNSEFHIKVESGEIQPMICEKCDIGFKSKKIFNKHTKICNNDSDNIIPKIEEVTKQIKRQCDLCKIYVRDYTSLKKHKKSDFHIKVQSGEIQPMICKKCDTGFKSKELFLSHITGCGKTDDINNTPNLIPPSPQQLPDIMSDMNDMKIYMEQLKTRNEEFIELKKAGAIKNCPATCRCKKKEKCTHTADVEKDFLLENYTWAYRLTDKYMYAHLSIKPEKMYIFDAWVGYRDARKYIDKLSKKTGIPKDEFIKYENDGEVYVQYDIFSKALKYMSGGLFKMNKLN